MKQTLQCLSVLLLVCGTLQAQTQFWSDNFEDIGAPTVGSRSTSIAEFSCNTPANYYFKRVAMSEIMASVAVPSNVFTNVQGTKFFAAMDIDRGPGCTNGNNQISAGQTITWSGINIAGKSGMSFKGLFGANTSGVFQGTAFPGVIDSMVVEYRINGTGVWTKIVGIFCNNSTASGGPLAVDNNNDRVGDGAPLTLALTEVSGNIAGTGNTMDLRFAIFNNNTAEGAMAIDNFRLFDGTVLPVKLASFDAVERSGSVLLNWTTTAETDNLGFDMERSTDGKSFHTIGSISSKAGNGNSLELLTYSFIDKAPVKGINLYRLAEKDKQGGIVYSDVRSVLVEQGTVINCFPNPVYNQLSLNYSSANKEQVSLKVIDLMGKVVLQKQLELQQGANKFNFDLSMLSPGLFNIIIIGNSGLVYSSKIIKD